MAKLVFLVVVCNVLCVALAQDHPESTTQIHKIETSSSVASSQEEPAVTQGEPAATQKQPPMLQTQPESEAKNGAGDVQGRVPLEPPKSPQTASSTTTDKPKGGSATICVNTGLLLVGAAVLLKL